MAKAKPTKVAWVPQPKQSRALSCPVTELFFGGAAGGGKSDFLLADFLRGVEYGSEHVGILFRRTFPQLEELIRRSWDLYRPLGAEYRAAEHSWTFPGGALLRFRHLESDMDVHDYQGHQFTWLGYDELTNWATDYPYIWMFSRLRSATGRPCRVRSAANPGGLGHGWVKQRFIEIGPPETIYMDPETGIKRIFIAAHLEDNQALVKADPDYERRLQALYPQLYRAYRFGDWDILSGQVFEEFRAEEHMVDPFPLDPGWFRFASLDWGYAKPFSIGWWAIDHDGRMIRYREWYGCEKGKHDVGVKLAAKAVAAEAWKLSVPEGCSDMVADPSCWNKMGLEGNCIAEEFAGAGWTMEPAINDRVGGWAKVHTMLKTRGSDGRPMMLAFHTCPAFRRIIPVLVADERHPEDVDTKQEDHVGDEVRYACMSPLSKRTSRPDTRREPGGDAQKPYDPLRWGLEDNR